ncbi:organic cation transporter protein-like isoform X1 [Amphibalanus amphitrite]|uniref:organic cation transporter protein-like isoform X1 n=2 Tax=Amphibalanus amphitrite TaxID=1232801 RepID=UPI001C9218AB|nr:organic cation transporter protein-like isoform X1 [Amphibalanus amphitrite]
MMMEVLASQGVATMLDVDGILEEIGGWGLYQKRMYLILCLPSIVAGAAVVSLSWTGYVMEHRCLVPSCENATSATYNAWFLNFTTPRDADQTDPAFPWSECQTFQSSVKGQCNASAFDEEKTEGCTQWVYDKSIMENTIVSEFDLSCGEDWLVDLANSLYMVGMLLGSLGFGYISDRFGRKIALMSALLLFGTASTITAFAPNYGTFAAMRLFTGIGGLGTFMITFVLSVEMVSNDVRTFCGFAIELFFSFGECLVGVLALWIKDWWILQLTIALPIFVFVSYWLFVPESIRWLAAEGRDAQAEKILRHVAEVNGKPFPGRMLQQLDKSQASEEKAEEVAAATVSDLFRSPALRWRTLIVLYQWFVTAMVYFGLAMNSTNLGGNVYLDFILVQLVDWPSIILCIVVLDPWGRKFCSSLCFLLAGAGSIASGLCSGNEGLEMATVGFALLGKFGAAGMFAIVFVYGAELFPTDVRNTGIGMSSAAGRIGSILAPFIAGLGKDSQVLPMSIFGVLSLVAGVVTLKLPETYGENLPETLEEAENFGRNQGLCFIPCLVARRRRKVENMNAGGTSAAQGCSS